MDLAPKMYVVESLDGDYAHLKENGDAMSEDKLVARALLPGEIQEGSRVIYEMMSYRMDN